MRFLAIVGIVLGQVAAAGPLPPIDISYDHAGLTRITIADSALTYVTHTLKTNLVAIRQDLTSYDRHEVVARLTEEDNRALQTWVRTNDWKQITKAYPSGQPGSYGASFQSTLDIKLSGVRHQASWDDTSDCPGIRKAVADLKVICGKIAESRKAATAEPTVGGDGEPAPQP